MAIECLDDPGEVGERAGQAVDLVDDHDVDAAGLHLGEQALQGRACQGAAGDPAVVVGGLDQLPALVPLARDVGGAGVALGVERVERLIQALLGGLARVDGTAEVPVSHGACR